MTDLDANALEAATLALCRLDSVAAQAPEYLRRDAEVVIRAYLAALPVRAEGEAEACDHKFNLTNPNIDLVNCPKCGAILPELPR